VGRGRGATVAAEAAEFSHFVKPVIKVHGQMKIFGKGRPTKCQRRERERHEDQRNGQKIVEIKKTQKKTQQRKRSRENAAKAVRSASSNL
jgi:hypothetical protein